MSTKRVVVDALELTASYLTWRDRAVARLVGKRMCSACRSCIIEEELHRAVHIWSGDLITADFFCSAELFLPVLCNEVSQRFKDVNIVIVPPHAGQHLEGHTAGGDAVLVYSPSQACGSCDNTIAGVRNRGVARVCLGLPMVPVGSKERGLPPGALGAASQMCFPLTGELSLGPNIEKSIAAIVLDGSACPSASIIRSIDNAANATKQLAFIHLRNLGGLQKLAVDYYCSTRALRELVVTDCDALVDIASCCYAQSKLQSVVVASCRELKNLGYRAFSGAAELSRVELAGLPMLTKLPICCFDGCVNLTSVHLNCENVREIESDCFRGCTKLQHIVLSGCRSLKEVCYSAFGGCSKLSRVDFSGLDHLERLSSNSFADCAELVSVAFTGCSALVEVGSHCFWRCRRLQSIDFNQLTALTNIGYFAFGCTGLSNVSLSGMARLESLDYSSFVACANLHSFHASGCCKLKGIGECCFDGCKASRR